MKFNSTVFERLLFPLHKRAYRQIQDALDAIDRKHPEQLQRALANFKEAALSDTQTVTWRPGKADEFAYPTFDIAILFNKPADYKLSTLHKSTDYKIAVYYDEKPPANYTGNHLQLGFFRGNVLNVFIVPLEYLLGFNEQAILREGSYQLYSHSILSQDNREYINKRMEPIGASSNANGLRAQQDYQKNALLYVGITKRTWQERYRQHCRDSGRGSNLRFHRALRGEFCQIGCIEHIVERAGLTQRQALEIEEKEVEKRSLHSLYPNGLNMIPGGYAGLKCVHEYAKRTGYNMVGELTADNLESVLVEVQRHTLNRHFNSDELERANAEIARLWAEDIQFRIKATTGQQNRFSFRQIQAARIWHACGWAEEKILEYLKRLDSKEIGMDQLQRLLRGETYASIPDVLI